MTLESLIGRHIPIDQMVFEIVEAAYSQVHSARVGGKLKVIKMVRAKVRNLDSDSIYKTLTIEDSIENLMNDLLEQEPPHD